MDKVLVDERHLRLDFFFAPWFLRCCLIADACRASAAGLARSRRRILPTEDVGMLAARSRRVGGATAAAIEELSQHDIAQLAEIKDQTWLDWYDSRTLERRLGISRALGW